MNLRFNGILAQNYSSPSQKIRVLTEDWVRRSIFCPNCGNLEIKKYRDGKPVADFYCESCKEDYELKSKKGLMGDKVIDGAYRTMLERLTSNNNPNFFLLDYDLLNLEVSNLVVIPKYYFVPNIIERRKPLSLTARRSGWVGCNILLKDIPQSGKIYFIKNKIAEKKENVIRNWKKTLFLKEEKEISAKGWLLDVMKCIERIGDGKFTLDKVYKFESILKEKHPENKHIKDKIRQQLQVLRDRGYLKFISRGRYSLK
ncbi:MAG: restriction endonuclease [Candidatus Firestonebacteria bacterium RIFOXYA2_FULL_40_8]|nr:MAG: restriction endonuclease [Candidatus Firestonebacteria bacterium RIFOXYA2_FULL_40_8]